MWGYSELTGARELKTASCVRWVLLPAEINTAAEEALIQKASDCIVIDLSQSAQQLKYLQWITFYRLLLKKSQCNVPAELVVCSDEKEEEEYEKEEVGEDGEIIVFSGDKVSGPWNKSGGSAPSAAAPVGE